MAFRNGSDRRTLPCSVDHSSEADWRPNWANILTWLMNDFLAVPDDSILEGNVQRQIVQTLNGLASLPGVQDCEVVLAAVEQFVGGISCRKGGYLTHGVTVASLQPMRPVPFRQVFVLGLGANGFPGRTSSTTLDVRGAGWRLGDTTLPKVNRYLFLETVMSTRDRLVLSYQNRDIEKDAELFSAGIVRELEDFIGSAIIKKPFEEFKGYPLLERGEANGEGPNPVCDVVWRKGDPNAGILPTYYKGARILARERMGMAETSSCWKKPEVMTAPDDITNPMGSREVSARELADFLKSPFRAVLNGQLGIAIEGYRDRELDVDSPLGVPEGPAKWELEGAGLDGADDFDRLFRQMQLAGELPAGFIGDFTKGRLCTRLSESIDALRTFAEEFGVKNGANLTSRQRVLSTIGSTNGDPVKVQYVAETPNWVESERGVSVLVTGWLLGQGGKDLPEYARPIDRTLAPFIAFLMNLAGRTDVDADTQRSLRVGVVDIENGKTAAWNWSISQNEAKRYLEQLTARYLDFLEVAKSPEGYVDFTYKKLSRALEGSDAGDWNGILGRLTKEDWGGNSKKNGFDNALVVEQAAAAYRCNPTADELKNLYERFYHLPMSGKTEGAGNGGAK